MNQRRTCLVVFTVVTWAAMVLMAPAASATTYGEIINYGDGKCLDMTGGSKSPGAQAQQWSCNGRPQQFWTYISVGGGLYLVQNKNSGLCLSILHNNTGNGAAVIQWNCNHAGTDRCEDWQFLPTGPTPDFMGPECDVYFMHPSGDGIRNGLKMYMGSGAQNSYLWTATSGV